MKLSSGMWMVSIATLITVSGIFYSFSHRSKEPPAKTKTNKSAVVNNSGNTNNALENQSIVHVDDLAQNPEKYKQSFVLDGVVAGVNKKEGVFGVIDHREFVSCGVLTCAQTTLPIKYSGELPTIESHVQIYGKLVETTQGQLIEADDVKNIKR